MINHSARVRLIWLYFLNTSNIQTFWSTKLGLYCIYFLYLFNKCSYALLHLCCWDEILSDVFSSLCFIIAGLPQRAAQHSLPWVWGALRDHAAALSTTIPLKPDCGPPDHPVFILCVLLLPVCHPGAAAMFLMSFHSAALLFFSPSSCASRTEHLVQPGSRTTISSLRHTKSRFPAQCGFLFPPSKLLSSRKWDANGIFTRIYWHELSHCTYTHPTSFSTYTHTFWLRNMQSE